MLVPTAHRPTQAQPRPNQGQSRGQNPAAYPKDESVLVREICGQRRSSLSNASPPNFRLQALSDLPPVQLVR